MQPRARLLPARAPLDGRVRGGACVVADQSETNHQGRWRPWGPPSGLAVRPAPPLLGPRLGAERGWCSARRSMRRSSRPVWRHSPTAGRPPHTQRPGLRGTSVSDSTGEASRRRAAARPAGRTATAGEVSVITQEWGRLGPLFWTPLVARLQLWFKFCSSRRPGFTDRAVRPANSVKFG